MKYLLFIFLNFAYYACTKDFSTEHTTPNTSIRNKPTSTLKIDTFFIAKGQHFANNDSTKFVLVDTNSISFQVKFNNSAIYQTAFPTNQTDVNKLYGFSDGGKHHHHFSARIGWAYYNNALRLFGYTYNDSIRTIEPITIIPIDTFISCSINMKNNMYIFTANGISIQMPRRAGTPKVLGYKLFPYFGGDEPAPHHIQIFIKKE